MNRQQLEQETARLLNDINNTRWSLATIDTRLEFAQQDVQIQTNALKGSQIVTPTANTAAVTINSDILDILSVTLTDSAGNVFPLKGVTKEELYVRRPLWLQEAAGQPDSYWPNFTDSVINLVPAPSSQWAITNAITVVEVEPPNAMTGNSSIPLSGNSALVPFHIGLCYWVAAECLMDNSDSESLQKAQYYRTGMLEKPGEYEKIIMKILTHFDKPTDARARILWRPSGGRLGGWPVSKSSPLG